MLIPLSLSTLFILQLIPSLERHEDSNYRIEILIRGLVTIQAEAFSFGKENQNYVGIIPSNAINLQSQLDWNSEIVNGNEGRFVLTWFNEFESVATLVSIISRFPEFTKSTERSGFFWGNYSNMDADLALIGNKVVPKPVQPLSEGVLIVGDQL